jgi:hypothetical protein
MVRFIGVQPPLHRARRQHQRLPPRRRLDRLEIDLGNGARADQRLDLDRDFPREGRFEAPFLAASSAVPGSRISASQYRTLISTKSFIMARNRWYSPISPRTISTASRGTATLTVFPATGRVSNHWGPWPGSPGWAHLQLGFPQRR